MAEYLSLPRFLETAREQGLDVTERTLNYYLARGLLPKPVRKPFVGADGRVSYLPSDALKVLRKILQLKDEGLKLEQIRRTLEGKGVAQQPNLEAREAWHRELVFRYLRHMPAGHYGPARVQLSGRLNQNERLGVDELRSFQIATLTPLVGETDAGRWVNQFYLRLPMRETERHLHAIVKENSGSKEEAGPSRIWLSVRQAVSHNQLRRITQEQFTDYLQALGAHLTRARAELGDAGWLGPGFELASSALLALVSADKEQSRPQLERLRAGLELLGLARQQADLEERAKVWLRELE